MKSFTISKMNGVDGIDSFSLYIALGNHITNYRRWATNLKNLGDEGVDFFKQKSMIFDPQPVCLRTRYHISLVFACEVCAAAKSEQGRLLKREFRRLLNDSNK